ncbi:hypothetical protein JCM15765_24430 [Paradesulfitobacterium aromaticivorans]
MSKRIPKNSICSLCNSGLKYKDCCGKGEPLRGTTMRFISSERLNTSTFEKSIYESLGHYPDDYINPVKSLRDVIYVLFDESNIGDHYAVSGIVVLKSEIKKNTGIYQKLRELVERYNIDYIHFTDILGRKNILGGNKRAFLKEYSSIAKELDMKPFTICMTENEIKRLLGISSISKEQCYMALTWRLMFNVLIHLTYTYGNELIIEMWRENENITTDKRLLHQINAEGVIKDFPFAHISIYRHYILFMKEELLFSSISDFVAYLTIGLYPKFNSKYSKKELANNYYDLLVAFNEIFDDTKGMKSDELDAIINIVKERELYRQSIGK